MNDRNLVRGLFLVAISLAFGLQSLRYPIGDFSRAGPGLFPLMVSALLLLIGVITVVRSLFVERVPLDFNFKNIAIILASLCGFALISDLREHDRRASSSWCSAPRFAGTSYSWVRNVKISAGLIADGPGRSRNCSASTCRSTDMDVLHNLAFGFEHALTLQNLMFCAIGCTVGTLVGLLPGLGPLATISLLLPLTYSIPTSGALIMLAGIYYGAQYGDSVSAITMKIPHASSIVACIDGYQMTLKGKTGLALFTAGVSSFIGGTVAIVVLAFLAPDARRGGLPVRAGGLLRADAGRLRVRELRHHRQPAQRPGDVPDRRAARADRHRRQQRRAALHDGPAVPGRRRRPGQHRAGLLRHRRDHQEPRQHATSARPSTARST